MFKNILRKILPHKEETNRVQQVVLLITQEKMKLKMVKDAVDIVNDVMERGGTIRLLLEDGLKEDPSPITFNNIKEYIFGIENEAPDILVVLDWEDEETIEVYKHYLLPYYVDDRISFVEKRVLLLFDTCERLGIPYRPIANTFVTSLGLRLEESFFVQLESWVNELDVEGNSQIRETDSLRIQFSREEVEGLEIKGISRIMDSLLADPQRALRKKNSMIFSFYGFSGNLEDLLDQDEIRSWASYVVEKYPFIFYFLNDEEVPMTRFLTSLVVSSHMKGETLYYDGDELEEFFLFIHQSLSSFAQWIGENPDQCIEEFYGKFHNKGVLS
ncbi:MAG TPA: hypothetical protein DDY49_01880 [Paenibacillaceae bacterium]|nr:hypothetical protein [Paenibacillaceae bacterium]